ncbi:MAG TPA: hypothetical protein ENG58_01760 [Thermotogales bacterium]|nr:hypothetical protein [Thermotogales bacterium]
MVRLRRSVIVYIGCPKMRDLEEYLNGWGLETESHTLELNFQEIKEKLFELVESRVNLLITVGGIGLTREDVVPEAILSIMDRRLHGLEFILLCDDDPRIPILRSIVGIRRKTLMITLPDDLNMIKRMLDRARKSILKALEVLEEYEESR